MTEKSETFMDQDIIICGAGPVGLTLALCLSQIDVKATVLCREKAPAGAADFDGRAYSISSGCWNVWKAIGCAEDLSEYCQPINRVEAEAAAFSPIRFGSDELENPDENLGYMIESRHILNVLWRKAKASDHIFIQEECQINDIRLSDTGASVFADGSEQSITAPLLVGCDGKHSRTRQSIGAGFPGHDYDAKGLVASVKLTTPHQGVARQVFLSTGPFAILPLQDNCANLVWTERAQVADVLANMDEADFAEELAERVGDFLGKFELIGPRFAYPLTMRVADRFVGTRAVLAGDAAHVIHPLAGQGLNLGLKDVATLAEIIADTISTGGDIGGAVALERYDSLRRPDVTSMAVGMDVLDKLFKGPKLLRGAAGMGMSFLERSPAIKSVFTKRASSVSDNSVPCLMRGEALSLG